MILAPFLEPFGGGVVEGFSYFPTFILFLFHVRYLLCVVLVEFNFNHVVVCTVPMVGR